MNAANVAGWRIGIAGDRPLGFWGVGGVSRLAEVPAVSAMAPVKSPALPHVLARLLQPNASKAARDPPTGSTIADQAGRLIIQGRCGDAFTILDNAIKKARPTINTRTPWMYICHNAY